VTIQITSMKEASFWEILILAPKHIVTFSVIKVQSVDSELFMFTSKLVTKHIHRSRLILLAYCLSYFNLLNLEFGIFFFT